MNPHKISAHSDNKQKSYGMLLVELVTWGVTNRDVLLLATIRYSEKATKFCEISTLDLSYVVPVKSTVEILQNFVAFSEYMKVTVAIR